MESDNISTFIEDAHGTLAGIRANILTAFHDSGEPDLAGSIGLAKRLVGTANGFPVAEFRSQLSKLETGLSEAASSSSTFDLSAAPALLDMIASLEAALGRALFNCDPPLDISAFVDRSFETLVVPPIKSLSAEPADDVEEAEPIVEDGFEIDDELLEVFAMEAEDLLAGIDSSLATLAASPNDRQALWQIRRNAHTLKGAAGIVGLKKQSKLAHRVEDFLDRLTESDAESNSAILDVLRSAAELLHAMIAGDDPERMPAELAAVNTRFDQLLASFGSLPPEGPAIVPSEPIETAEDPKRSVSESASPKHDRRSVVRVSLDRLDDLVKNSRELVTTRSVFEQRLEDLERRIDELHDSTRRLQVSCSNVEMDVEAGTLSESARVYLDGQGDEDRGTAKYDSLELDRYTEFHRRTREIAETAAYASAIGGELETVRENLKNSFSWQRRLINQMQEGLMQIRMVKFDTIATRLQRAVRVTCEEERKEAEIAIENAHLEIDTQVLDSLVEPLIHLLKNAVVHGIEAPDTRRLLGKPETGRILIRLANEETHLILSVEDDGRGIVGSKLKEKAVASGLLNAELAENLTPAEEIELIFSPGLTTAEKLNLSAGRGVGMSIVKQSIEAQKGSVSVASSPQTGTVFTLRLPLPLAITGAVIVRTGRQTFAVPAKQISSVEVITGTLFHERPEPDFLVCGGSTRRLRFLEKFIGKELAEPDSAVDIPVLLLELKGENYAIPVDEVVRTEEVVIETLAKPLDSIRGILGAAVLGNGDLVTILDLPILLAECDNIADTSAPDVKAQEKIIMVVDDSPSVRHTTTKTLQNAGWIVEAAKDGVDALEKLESGNKLPSVILSDLEMPRMGGYELMAAIKENMRFNHVPVIIVSSRSGDKYRERAFENGAARYLTKPFEERELLSAIEQHSM